MIVVGKILEILGALLVSIPIMQVAFRELRISSVSKKAISEGNSDIKAISLEAEKARVSYRDNFNRRDAIYVIIGVSIFIIGSVASLIGSL